jgi:hypothetical protein
VLLPAGHAAPCERFLAMVRELDELETRLIAALAQWERCAEAIPDDITVHQLVPAIAQSIAGVIDSIKAGIMAARHE